MSVPSPHAVLPLTLFDDAYSPTNFMTGWLVEGLVDEAKFASALTRLVDKWRLLSGRLESVQGNPGLKWQLRIPLGDIPAEYKTFSLTSRVSDTLISAHVQLPLAPVSQAPHYSLFMNPATPYDSAGWAANSHPLTWWHLTYFPADTGLGHTCIGLAWPHGVFDGVAISFILRALGHEMHGRKWDVPELPREGYNVNTLQEALDVALIKTNLEGHPPYRGITAFAALFAIIGLLRCAWETWWCGAQSRVVILPKKVHSTLTDQVRERLAGQGELDVRVTSGDVLTAWFFKTLFSVGWAPTTLVHCSYIVSFRDVFSSDMTPLKDYPHNCHVPIPHPIMPVADLIKTPLHTLALTFARSRLSLSTAQPLGAYKMFQELTKKRAFLFSPTHSDADKALVVSNVSANRIVEVDWSAIGAGPTICSYRDIVSPLPLRFTYLSSLSGRLADGSALIEAVLTKSSWDRIEVEAERLIAEFSSVVIL